MKLVYTHTLFRYVVLIGVWGAVCYVTGYACGVVNTLDKAIKLEAAYFAE